MQLSKIFPTLFAAAIFVVSCKARNESSEIKGHFEGEAQNIKFESYAGNLLIPPQYAPTKAVILSDRTLTFYGMYDLARSIIQADVKLWLLAKTTEISPSLLADNTGLEIEKVKANTVKFNAPTNSAWVRDYAPFAAFLKHPNNSSRSTSNMIWIDENYYTDRPADDRIPTAIAFLANDERVSIPIYNEGGNFMTTGKHCFMTDRVLEANSRKSMSRSLDEEVLTAIDVKKYYKLAAGCSQVTIFPRMPYEGTGHIDMWAKVIGDQEVVVSQLDSFAIQDGPLPIARDIRRDVRIPPVGALNAVQNFLDERANDFKNLGFKVTRIPMPLPVQLPPMKGSPEGIRVDRNYLFRSFANALIINSFIIVPQYLVPDSFELSGTYPDYNLEKFYHSQVEEIYGKTPRYYNGKRLPPLKVLWVNADKAIATGGAVHCLTMQVPAGSK